jgi:hypothetical protein
MSQLLSGKRVLADRRVDAGDSGADDQQVDKRPVLVTYRHVRKVAQQLVSRNAAA